MACTGGTRWRVGWGVRDGRAVMSTLLWRTGPGGSLGAGRGGEGSVPRTLRRCLRCFPPVTLLQTLRPSPPTHLAPSPFFTVRSPRRGGHPKCHHPNPRWWPQEPGAGAAGPARRRGSWAGRGLGTRSWRVSPKLGKVVGGVLGQVVVQAPGSAACIPWGCRLRVLGASRAGFCFSPSCSLLRRV